jgi:hypothetical protein
VDTVDLMSLTSAVPGPAAVTVRSGAVPRGQLRGTAWHRLSRGLYVPAQPLRSNLATLESLAQVLPRDSTFGHLTAAAARRWWLPNLLPAHVVLASTRSGVHVQRTGVYVRRSRYLEIEEVDGVPLADAATTLLELARDLTLVDLVPMVDRALAEGGDPAKLVAACRPGTRGATTLRRAIALGDPRSESWWESVLRLIHVLTGLGPVACQVEVFDDHGALVARTDLHLVGTHRYPECDGGQHRTADRHDVDLRRAKAMSRLGAERYGYTTREISRLSAGIIRDAEEARGLRHDPGRARLWNRLAAVSTLTGHGRARLRARLRRYELAARR